MREARGGKSGGGYAVIWQGSGRMETNGGRKIGVVAGGCRSSSRATTGSCSCAYRQWQWQSAAAVNKGSEGSSR